MITDERLQELEELAEKATEGPWCWESVAEKSNEFIVGLACDAEGNPLRGDIAGMRYDEKMDCWVEDEIIRSHVIGANESGSANFADAAFIAAAREAMPELVYEVRSLRALLEASK